MIEFQKMKKGLEVGLFDKKEFLKCLKNDNSFKEEVITAIVSDRQFIDMIAKEIFCYPAKSVGLNCYGTIAEYFCNDRHKGIRRRN